MAAQERLARRERAAGWMSQAVAAQGCAEPRLALRFPRPCRARQGVGDSGGSCHQWVDAAPADWRLASTDIARYHQGTPAPGSLARGVPRLRAAGREDRPQLAHFQLTRTLSSLSSAHGMSTAFAAVWTTPWLRVRASAQPVYPQVHPDPDLAPGTWRLSACWVTLLQAASSCRRGVLDASARSISSVMGSGFSI